jgi:hypothetical protein
MTSTPDYITKNELAINKVSDDYWQEQRAADAAFAATEDAQTLVKIAYDKFRVASLYNNSNFPDYVIDPFDDLPSELQQAWKAIVDFAYAQGQHDGYGTGVTDTRVQTFCGKVDGAETCDRMQGHAGDCSWHSSLIVTNMARQINELYQMVQGAKTMLPPGMLGM